MRTLAFILLCGLLASAWLKSFFSAPIAQVTQLQDSSLFTIIAPWVKFFGNWPGIIVALVLVLLVGHGLRSSDHPYTSPTSRK